MLRNRSSLRFAGRRSSAFTLMELLVVCLLIAVMAAIIVPEMRSSFEDALLRSSGRKLVDVFGLAYSRAVSLNQLHRVRLDKYSGQYLIEKQIGDTLEEEDFEPATDIAGFKGQIDSRISMDIQISEPEVSDDSISELQNQAPLSSEAICFYSDGTADPCDILLRDRMGFQLVLQISPTTGRVHLLEHANDEAQTGFARRGQLNHGPSSRFRSYVSGVTQHATRNTQHATRSNSAFSLVEVMIALLILGVALVGFVQGTTTAITSSKESEIQTTAALLASGRVEQIRADGELEDGESDGDWGDDYPNYSWTQSIAPTDVPGLHEIRVTIEDARTGKQLFELRTMLFEPPLIPEDETTSKSKKKKRKGAEE